MFQPEMATTWLTPAVAKSAASVAIDALPEADEDPGGQAGLGLWERALDRVAAPVAQRLEAEGWRRNELERPRVERAGRARSAQVRPVRIVVGRRSQVRRRP